MGGILPDQKCFGLRIWSVLYVVSIYLVDIAVLEQFNWIAQIVSFLLFAELSLCVLLPHRQLISVSSSVPHSVRFSWKTSAFQSTIWRKSNWATIQNNYDVVFIIEGVETFVQWRLLVESDHSGLWPAGCRRHTSVWSCYFCGKEQIAYFNFTKDCHIFSWNDGQHF